MYNELESIEVNQSIWSIEMKLNLFNRNIIKVITTLSIYVISEYVKNNFFIPYIKCKSSFPLVKINKNNK